MNNPETLRSALFQISRPVFVFRQDNRLCVAHDCTGHAQTVSENTDTAGALPFDAFAPAVLLSALGDAAFTARHNLAYPYVAGDMANGISSVEMVRSMADNGMLGFFGAGGLSLEQIRQAVTALTTGLKDRPFGLNLIHSLGDPDHEMATVQLYLDHGIRLISAAAFMRMTPALVYFRVKGIHVAADGQVTAPNRIIAKVSRVEVARQFFSPPPEKLVQELVDRHLITRQEADLSRHIPMAQDLTAEADSGGHTDNRPALALLPTMITLKNQFMAEYRYPAPLCVG
ncbi:MAG TPA: nitronate monooxygenase, partial [Desulfotignum sp.]|nr:nitronate monooxygenase [Desulfotignum sp.]